MPSLRVGLARAGGGRRPAESIRPGCPGVLPNLSWPLPKEWESPRAAAAPGWFPVRAARGGGCMVSGADHILTIRPARNTKQAAIARRGLRGSAGMRSLRGKGCGRRWRPRRHRRNGDARPRPAWARLAAGACPSVATMSLTSWVSPVAWFRAMMSWPERSWSSTNWYKMIARFARSVLDRLVPR